MLSWMLAYVEQVSDSEFTLPVSLKLLQSLTPLQQLERLPAYLRNLRDEAMSSSASSGIGLLLNPPQTSLLPFLMAIASGRSVCNSCSGSLQILRFP